ncbi:hypothetical protein CBW46_002840 [Paenibacillus xerothermodurans]|uniref:Uncharacterized protein n=1 Tax=Paenibacillus xerothermodurans TaxID=1977292 RepID=A0A2W1NGA8_PAEXE|nr:hypothetical protein CBW46_002840 [Paenibacillus xerothermodurans]
MLAARECIAQLADERLFWRRPGIAPDPAMRRIGSTIALQQIGRAWACSIPPWPALLSIAVHKSAELSRGHRTLVRRPDFTGYVQV